MPDADEVRPAPLPPAPAVQAAPAHSRKKDDKVRVQQSKMFAWPTTNTLLHVDEELCLTFHGAKKYNCNLCDKATPAALPPQRALGEGCSGLELHVHTITHIQVQAAPAAPCDPAHGTLRFTHIYSTHTHSYIAC